mmetsp:Transcript_2940/g.3301  ORF Transcript_2940/g.3301 Transcript_2940/m.3301 type:complete len:1007 (+) Transcript_2940:102-3122(+)|eukprot:CAMPEP_0170818792 /NCGR_PEP_ID=MMETSP0733-20121128/40999_1 /TAXON_ID=186038 /ORGANISM="Fragilariopsis kerguelensis, Strain L26-C5" /LENGTH=1006 /DNA_ID=CAMNT_0011179077 /DNA_START=102 /DNA_END=3122 /DNA_ORIENTATION=-
MVWLRSILLAGTAILLYASPFFTSYDDNEELSKFAFAFSSTTVISSRSSSSSHRLSTASSFVGRNIAHNNNSNRSKMTTVTKRSTGRIGSTTGLTMVIDRMSNDCVAGIQKAHEIGNSIGLDSLRSEIIFCGMVASPERAARTLERYKMDNSAEVETSAIRTLQFKLPTSEFDANINNNSISTGDKSNKNEPLPFSDESRTLLTKACQIADRMESPTVRSEHVILALMGYNNGLKIEVVPVMDLLRNIPSLKQVNRETGGFTVTQFCLDLVNALPMTPVPSTPSDDLVVKDTVVVGGSQKSGGSTNTLNEVGVDMTQMALDGKIDVIFGRDQEIRSALRTLGRRRKNNPCLIGDPGVGKTAVAEGIAQVLANGIVEMGEAKKENNPLSKMGNQIANLTANLVSGGRKNKDDNNSETEETSTAEEESDEIVYQLPPCPASLLGARVISIELAGLVAGTANRGDFERKMKNLIQEASENNVILFVDEIHNLIGTGGGGDGAMNAANLLKPALARGELRLMGATTTPEYRKYIEKDGALERRFQPLVIKEPTVSETLEILGAISPKYEEFHGVEYTYNALVAATKLSNRYINDRFLPDKAIDMIDEAGSMIKMSEDEEESFYVTEDAIQTVVAEITGIPVGKLDTGEKARLKNLENELEKRIKGQTPAVRAVAKAIRRARSGMRDGKRPVSSLLFCGPTGVGKTELCKCLAETYYGEEKNLVRIDMSEYMDRFSTSRLIGAPPGYVGYEEGGQLTEAVRRQPHSVILFDELEKAHEDVLNLLLQIMDEGTLTDGKGRTVSFKNNIFVMTSNIGSREIVEAARSMDQDVDENQLTSGVVKGALEEALKPELLNRIDEIIVFSPLPYERLKEIAKNLINNTVKRVADDQNLVLTVSDNIAEIVTREALESASIYGARPIRRAVQRYLEDTMAEAIMSDFIQEGDSVSLNLRDPNSGKKVVEIRREIDGESVLIDVDADAGISKESIAVGAAYGDVPNLDDGPPEQEPDAFQ